jgi:hypothetical protein
MILKTSYIAQFHEGPVEVESLVLTMCGHFHEVVHASTCLHTIHVHCKHALLG